MASTNDKVRQAVQRTTGQRVSTARSFSIAAFVLAAVSLIMLPIAGIVGAVCGLYAARLGDRTLGLAATVASVAGFVLSFYVIGSVLG